MCTPARSNKINYQPCCGHYEESYDNAKYKQISKPMTSNEELSSWGMSVY